MFSPSFSPQYHRLSKPAVSAVSLDTREGPSPEASWAAYQLWVWPYKWRKTSSNLTVLAPYDAPPAPQPAPPPAEDAVVDEPVRAPSPPASYAPAAPSTASPESAPAAPTQSTAAPSVTASNPQQGSLVWKIPPTRKGG
jgi:hypothetical protein